MVNIAKAYNIKNFSQADNEESDSDVGASQLFYQWVMGTGEGKRNFDKIQQWEDHC
ncbi:hypothetical protein ACFSX9_00370 [Flavobacterium ardleyense]|uniref:Uncharacterized protein n=1 Tax=Flavobacterium ardleyense TaxID=2038737 RepID=A0ABW5Z339_9FLAO